MAVSYLKVRLIVLGRLLLGSHVVDSRVRHLDQASAVAVVHRQVAIKEEAVLMARLMTLQMPL